MIPTAYIAKKLADKKQADSSLPDQDNNNLTEVKGKAITVGVLALGIGAAFFVGRKVYRNIREKRTERKFTEESQQALLLRSAINPSGASWLIWMDGTKEEAIFNIASQIINFRKVQQDYQNLYNHSLVKDLQKELKTDEYNKFMNIINSGSIQDSNVEGDTSYSTYSPTGTSQNDIQGKVILIEKTTRIYEKFTWYPFGSVKKVEPGYFINHLTTGEVKKLNAGYGMVVTYVEIRIKTTEGMVKTVFVKQSDIKLVTKEDFISNYQNSYTKLIFKDDDF